MGLEVVHVHEQAAIAGMPPFKIRCNPCKRIIDVRADLHRLLILQIQIGLSQFASGCGQPD